MNNCLEKEELLTDLDCWSDLWKKIKVKNVQLLKNVNQRAAKAHCHSSSLDYIAAWHVVIWK